MLCRPRPLRWGSCASPRTEARPPADASPPAPRPPADSGGDSEGRWPCPRTASPACRPRRGPFPRTPPDSVVWGPRGDSDLPARGGLSGKGRTPAPAGRAPACETATTLAAAWPTACPSVCPSACPSAGPPTGPRPRVRRRLRLRRGGGRGSWKEAQNLAAAADRWQPPSLADGGVVRFRGPRGARRRRHGAWRRRALSRPPSRPPSRGVPARLSTPGVRAPAPSSKAGEGAGQDRPGRPGARRVALKC